MPTDAELFRMLRAIMRVADRHGESKVGSRLLHLPVLPHEMKELRASLEPFRERYRSMERLAYKRVEEVTSGAPPTAEEAAIRAIVFGAPHGR
jgi:hypothetical protein